MKSLVKLLVYCVILLAALPITRGYCPIQSNPYVESLHRSKLAHRAPPAQRCQAPPPQCVASDKFPRIDGTCYNLHQPTLGSTNDTYSRLEPAAFDDGIYAPRLSRGGRRALPSTRLIGDVALQHSVYEPRPTCVPNHGSLIFGQYITHDVGFIDMFRTNAANYGLRCCSEDNQNALPESNSYYHCMAVQVPADDTFCSKAGGGCVDYLRSQPEFGSAYFPGEAEIVSSVTHYLDHSNIYGSSPAVANSVRAYSAGHLLNSPNRLFPRRTNCTGDFCYFTGDLRGAFYPTLSLWHSIFIRLHNQLADGLAMVNGHWCDDRLFEEARRLCTAIYHNIVFNEWLPPYIGCEMSKRRHVSSTCRGHYDEHVNGASLQEFSTGVFRVFHTNTPNDICMYDEAYVLRQRLPLNESIHGPGILEREYEGVMRGFFADPIAMDGYPDNVRNTVFNNVNAGGIAMDMCAVDILRGRDHGLAAYYVYLERYWRENGDSRTRHRTVSDWSSLECIFSAQSIERMRAAYDSVFDVDLLVGLLLEQKRGTLLGPVGVWLMEEQFYRYKFGNRFHYSHVNGPYPMSDAQVEAVTRMGFAEVLCWCSDIEAVPRRVFEVLGTGNPLQTCSGYVLDVELWRELQC